MFFPLPTKWELLPTSPEKKLKNALIPMYDLLILEKGCLIFDTSENLNCQMKCDVMREERERDEA